MKMEISLSLSGRSLSLGFFCSSAASGSVYTSVTAGRMQDRSALARRLRSTAFFRRGGKQDAPRTAAGARLAARGSGGYKPPLPLSQETRHRAQPQAVHAEAHLNFPSGAVVYGASSAPLKIHGGGDADLGAGTM